MGMRISKWTAEAREHFLEIYYLHVIYVLSTLLILGDGMRADQIKTEWEVMFSYLCFPKNSRRLEPTIVS